MSALRMVPEPDLAEGVLDKLPLGAVVLDAQGTVLRFNRYEEQLSGRRREEVIGRSFFDDVAPCLAELSLKERFLEGVRRRDLDLDLEFRFPYPYNRVPRDVRVRALSLGGPGQAAHLLLVEDVSARKSLERSNRELHARLRWLLGHYLGEGYAARLEAAPGGALTAREEEAAVLFADLSGFTAYASGVEPAALFARLSARLADAISAIHRRGGVVDKLLGDGVLGYFPLSAGGAAALDALRAARDILRAGPDPLGLPLPFRVGVAQGKVVVGTVGSAEFGNVTVIGHAVNLAKRLQEAARPGEAVLCEATAHAARGAARTSLVAGLSLKGLPGVSAAFRLEGLDLP